MRSDGARLLLGRYKVNELIRGIDERGNGRICGCGGLDGI
jgi:hypothetical protein